MEIYFLWVKLGEQIIIPWVFSFISFDKKFLLLCGFENFGNYYIRVDILEKLFLKIIDNTQNGKFKISSEMMNLLGCSKEDFFKVMGLMDYKKEKKDEDIFIYKGSKKINKIKFLKRKNNPFQKLSALNLKQWLNFRIIWINKILN